MPLSLQSKILQKTLKTDKSFWDFGLVLSANLDLSDVKFCGVAKHSQSSSNWADTSGTRKWAASISPNPKDYFLDGEQNVFN